MPPHEKIQVAVYRIDDSNYGDGSFQDIVGDIMRKIDKKCSPKWAPQALNNIYNGYEVAIYARTNKNPPAWQEFLKPALDKDSILLQANNYACQYLCFIGIKGSIFVISGGISAFHAISGFVASSFGLDILVRVIKKDNPVIKGLQDRGISGVVLGQQRYFREEQRLTNDEELGKIYKEVTAELADTILVKKFKFSKASLTNVKAGCLATDSFKLKKAINFDTALQLCEAFAEILQEKPKFTLNKVQVIDRKKQRDIVTQLELSLMDQLYTAYAKGEPFEIDLLHEKFVPYLEADSYEININSSTTIKFDRHPTFQKVIDKIKIVGFLEASTMEEFNRSVLQRHLISFDENGNEATSGSIISHLNGEVVFEKKKYLLVDGLWYLIQPAFVADLNRECEEILDRHSDNSLVTEVFQKDENEGDFNLRYVGRQGWLVLDTVTPENIELCDLLYNGGDRLFLIHVKKGFDNSLRDLTAQIELAAKRLRADTLDSYKFVSRIEDSVRTRKLSKSASSALLGSQTIPKGGLRGLFEAIESKNIYFVLAFVDTAEKNRVLSGNVQHFKSDIAKYFFIQLYRTLNSMFYDFKVVQLARTP